MRVDLFFFPEPVLYSLLGKNSWKFSTYGACDSPIKLQSNLYNQVMFRGSLKEAFFSLANRWMLIKPKSPSYWGFVGMWTVRTTDIWVWYSVLKATRLSRSWFVKRPVLGEHAWTLCPSFLYSSLSQYSQAWDCINCCDIRNPPNSWSALKMSSSCPWMESANFLATLPLMTLARLSTISNWKSKMFSLRAPNSAIDASKFSQYKIPLAIAAFAPDATTPSAPFIRSQKESLKAPHLAMFWAMRCPATFGV